MGLRTDLTSEEYHGLSGSYSSSQFKDILADPELFYNKYIAKTVEKQSIPAFDVGTFFHTAVLEPHLLMTECAVYTGIRRGKAWDEFQEENKGKAIITATEKVQADTLIKAVMNSTIAMDLIEKGTPEISAFIEIVVNSTDVYTKSEMSGRVYKLGLDGWEMVDIELPEGPLTTKLIIKVRADILGEKKFILDLKSTTGNCKDKHTIKTKISSYNYDMSASMYLDVFTIASGEVYDTFVWTFASKDVGNCKNWIADRDTIRIGRKKWKKAAIEIGKYTRIGWKFEDTIEEIEPAFYEREWLQERVEDEL